MMTRLIAAIFALFVGFGLIQTDVRAAGLVQTPLTIETAAGPRNFTVEIADNDLARERGLMFRTALAADRGMLFDFVEPQETAFWMKNTLIPLDMLFVRADGVIANIKADAKPGDLNPIPSDGPIRAVIEIAGGGAAKLGIKPGDHVKHPIFK
jgi:uncharacterized membrane protein (UPF0127 family)